MRHEALGEILYVEYRKNHDTQQEAADAFQKKSKSGKRFWIKLAEAVAQAVLENQDEYYE